MLERAKELLYLQYNQCVKVVDKDDFYLGYAEEKLRHSLQVAGAGNYLLRHINWFKEKPAEYIEMVQTVILLHDICRFAEISERYKGAQKYDHGVAAYEFLQYTPLFNDIKIRLPIKHHGHRIKDLYADAEYRNLPEDVREQVQKICFIVRDADKIANFHMITNEPRFLPLFMGLNRPLTEADLQVSDNIKQSAFVEDTASRPAHTLGDRAVSFFSWYMDINYRASLNFCDKLGVTKQMFRMFDKYCGDTEFKQKYIAFVQKHLNTHQFID